MKKTPKTERLSIMVQRTGGLQESPRGALFKSVLDFYRCKKQPPFNSPVCRAASFRLRRALQIWAANNQCIRPLSIAVKHQNGVLVCRESGTIALSCAAVLALSSAALAQGGGAGGGGGGGAAGGASSGAAGAAGTTGSGTNAAQSTRGQSSPSGNATTQPPGSARARMASIPQGRELGQEAPVPALADRAVPAARADSDKLAG